MVKPVETPGGDKTPLKPEHAELRRDEEGRCAIWVHKPVVFLAEDTPDEDYEAIANAVYPGTAGRDGG